MSGFIVNHLWQSTCFVALAWLIASALRGNSAKVRYWVWLGASLKFLVPLALLMSLGSSIRLPVQRAASVTAPVFQHAFVHLAEPFVTGAYSGTPTPPSMRWAPLAIGVVWAFGFLAIAWARCRSWLRVRATLDDCVPVELPIPVPALLAQGPGEPGVVGFLRPVLVFPAPLLKHLNPRQLDAILAHELCHVRRRDNLFAAVHMAVEAIFWFHPLVWWIGRRMVEERELACDEEVLRTGSAPADYAEGILKVCRFVAESPLPCISGVTGADVGKRIGAILAGTIGRELSASRRAVLAGIGLAAIAVPVFIGALNAPTAHAQSPARVAQSSPSANPAPPGPPSRPVAKPVAPLQFEAASVKAAPEGPFVLPQVIGRQNFRDTGTMTGPASLLEWAYGVRDFQVVGAPAWLKQEAFEIQARAEHPSTAGQIRQMVQGLLADRFRLRLHRERGEIPVYALVAGKNGTKLTLSRDDGLIQGLGDIETRPGKLWGTGATMTLFSYILTDNLDRPVVDKTKFSGHYDFTLTYDEPTSTGGVFTPIGPAIFRPIQDIGLRLVPEKDTFEMLVIDSVSRPSEN